MIPPLNKILEPNCLTLTIGQNGLNYVRCSMHVRIVQVNEIPIRCIFHPTCLLRPILYVDALNMQISYLAQKSL